MDLVTEEVTIELPLSIQNDLEVDDNGTLNIITVILREDDEAYEVKLDFDRVIENLLDHYDGMRDVSEAQQLYLIAHELGRQAVRLRAVAELLEGGIIDDDEDDYDDEEQIIL
jgi:hypothetical protein|tara:strand:- start:186 stop:524 length:339 start_codon:yes stop_codon:yes gene_type:complete